MKTMIILLFAVLTSVSVTGQNLTLIVKDVEHVDGSVYVVIYSSKQTFMKFSSRSEGPDDRDTL